MREDAVIIRLSQRLAAKIKPGSLRPVAQQQGFRRSAPAFVITMMNLADKGAGGVPGRGSDGERRCD